VVTRDPPNMVYGTIYKIKLTTIFHDKLHMLNLSFLMDSKVLQSQISATDQSIHKCLRFFLSFPAI
jgi:hypothetical protein